MLKKEQKAASAKKLLSIAHDRSGVEKFFRGGVGEFEYGMDTSGGLVQDPRQNKRVINRVLGENQ